MRKLISLPLLVTCSITALAGQQAPRRPATFAPEGVTPISLGLAGYAKVLCSG